MPTILLGGGMVGGGVPVHHKVSDAYAIKCHERNTTKGQYLYAGKNGFCSIVGLKNHLADLFTF